MMIIAPQIPQNITLEERYLVALVGEQKIAFSASWVQEILLIPRSRILELPFYDSSLLGIVHHQNQIVPLISGQKIFLNKIQQISQATLTAVRLNQLGQHLTGVGVVVDRMVESLSAQELSLQPKLQLTEFQFSDIPQHIWQPQR
jgi:chemotaxis signal transduction protein